MRATEPAQVEATRVEVFPASRGKRWRRSRERAVAVERLSSYPEVVPQQIRGDFPASSTSRRSRGAATALLPTLLAATHPLASSVSR